MKKRYIKSNIPFSLVITNKSKNFYHTQFRRAKKTLIESFFLIKVSTAPLIYNYILYHLQTENQLFFLASYLFSDKYHLNISEESFSLNFLLE